MRKISRSFAIILLLAIATIATVSVYAYVKYWYTVNQTIPAPPSSFSLKIYNETSGIWDPVTTTFNASAYWTWNITTQSYFILFSLNNTGIVVFTPNITITSISDTTNWNVSIVPSTFTVMGIGQIQMFQVDATPLTSTTDTLTFTITVSS